MQKVTSATQLLTSVFITSFNLLFLIHHLYCSCTGEPHPVPRSYSIYAAPNEEKDKCLILVSHPIPSSEMLSCLTTGLHRSTPQFIFESLFLDARSTLFPETSPNATVVSAPMNWCCLTETNHYQERFPFPQRSRWHWTQDGFAHVKEVFPRSAQRQTDSIIA